MLLKNAIIILLPNGILREDVSFDYLDNLMVYDPNELPSYVSDMLLTLAGGPDSITASDAPFDLSDYDAEEEDVVCDCDELVDVKFYKSGRLSREIFDDYEVKYYYTNRGNVSRSVVTSY